MTYNEAFGDRRIESMDGETYTLRFDINAICSVEAKTGKKIGDLEEELENPSMTVLRGILSAGLECHHPELSEQEVGRMFRMTDLAGKVAEALRAAFPEEQEGDPGNPPGAASGTSGGASPHGSRSSKRSTPSGA